MYQHVQVSNALKSGKMIKPANCSVCGSTYLIEGHHEDYSKPLDVVWLCKTCHTNVHKNSDNPPGRKPKINKAKKVLTVYFTDEQYATVQKYCKEKGSPFSIFVRNMLTDKKII